MPQICSSTWSGGPDWPSSAMALGHGLQPSFKGNREKELKAVYPNIPRPSGGLNKINVLLLHMKNRQEAARCMNTHSLQFHVLFEISGPHLSWWKSGNPSWAVWMSASWRQAPSTAALCFLPLDSLIRGEHATRAPGMAKNQIKLYQTLNYNKRMNMSECEHIDG